jgi:hypothetical protein
VPCIFWYMDNALVGITIAVRYEIFRHADELLTSVAQEKISHDHECHAGPVTNGSRHQNPPCRVSDTFLFMRGTRKMPRYPAPYPQIASCGVHVLLELSISHQTDLVCMIGGETAELAAYI